MTETATAYELEHEEWQRKPDAEPLPECETGSVEQMLEAAIRWNAKFSRQAIDEGKRFGYKLVVADFGMRLESQTQLLRNILAKMEIEEALSFRNILAKLDETVTQPELEEWPWDKCVGMHMQCPYCGDAVLVTTKLEPTADRRVAKGS